MGESEKAGSAQTTGREGEGARVRVRACARSEQGADVRARRAPALVQHLVALVAIVVRHEVLPCDAIKLANRPRIPLLVVLPPDRDPQADQAAPELRRAAARRHSGTATHASAAATANLIVRGGLRFHRARQSLRPCGGRRSRRWRRRLHRSPLTASHPAPFRGQGGCKILQPRPIGAHLHTEPAIGPDGNDQSCGPPPLPLLVHVNLDTGACREDVVSAPHLTHGGAGAQLQVSQRKLRSVRQGRRRRGEGGGDWWRRCCGEEGAVAKLQSVWQGRERRECKIGCSS